LFLLTGSSQSWYYYVSSYMSPRSIAGSNETIGKSSDRSIVWDLLSCCRRRYRRYRGRSRMRVGGAATSLLKRVDVLESYRDKKGHPKDTPDSRRRNSITIDIDSLGTRSLRTLDTMREREKERCSTLKRRHWTTRYRSCSTNKK